MSSGFGLNTNILETNVLNLAVVLWVVVTVVGDAVRVLLEQRKKAILTTLEDVDRRVKEAQQQLVDAQKAVEEARLYAKEIRDKAVQDSERERSIVQSQSENEWKRIQERSSQTIQIERQREKTAITKQVVQRVLQTREKRLWSRLIQTNDSVSKQSELNDKYVRETFRQVKRWSSKNRFTK